MSGGQFSDQPRDGSRIRKEIDREVQSKKQVSETVEEFDAETGRITKRTVRSETEEAKISEHEVSEQQVPLLDILPPKRLGQAGEFWFQTLPTQLKVSVFQLTQSVPQELTALAGDYILTLVSGTQESARWEYRFPTYEGLYRILLTANPTDSGRLAVSAGFEGTAKGPQWLGVADMQMQRPFSLYRDWNAPPALLAHDKWPNTIDVMALASPGGRIGEAEQSARYTISPYASSAEMASMAALSGSGSSSSGPGDDPVPPPTYPECEEECGCPPNPPPPGPPGPPSPPGGGPPSGPPCGNGLPCGTPLNSSANPIRYATGEVLFRQTDITSSGFGTSWGHTRSFASRLSENVSLGNGYNWQVREWMYLSFLRTNGVITTVVVQSVAGSAIWFDKVGSSFQARFGVKNLLSFDSINDRYLMENPDGTVVEFKADNGAFLKRTDAGGAVIEVTAYATDGFNPTNVQRAYTSGSDTITEEFHYEFDSSAILPLLQNVTLRRKVNAGSWQNVLRSTYSYYDFDEDYGLDGDLKAVTTQEWNNSAWSDTGTTYYRYETPLFIEGTATVNPKAHLLRYILLPATFERFQNDPNVSDPFTASDSLVAQYADYYYEYDDDRRCTKEIVQGGSMTFTYSYTDSTNVDGPNSWKHKTVETRPDGTVNTVFTNTAGLSMLTDLEEGSSNWISFFKYDSENRPIMQANPSAVTGYDEASADLLEYNSGTGKYTYLRDNSGLIRLYTVDATSGYTTSKRIQEGQLGTEIKLRDLEYIACPETGFGNVYVMSKQTVYPSDTDQTKTIVTSFEYTWYSNTSQVQQMTTTLPVISTSQNGSGVANTTKVYFNSNGYRTWSMDERGYITRLKYDIPTGAIVQRIADVDTSIETDAPSGWTTPSDGGLNLITDFEHDDRGRTTQTLGPSHEIDLAGTATTVRRATWMVYDEGAFENTTRIAQGYATGSSPSYTYTLVNPVVISIADKNGKPQQEIQASRASTSGKLLPSDTFAQSSYTRWTTMQYTDCCNQASQRVYHTIPASGSGSSGTNYDETSYGYDAMKRRNRNVTPGGTITRTVFDARGLATENWMGTDDTGATSTDPSGGGATGNNMVILNANQYDDNTDGGDGNLTQETQYVDGSDIRVTAYSYDFRNRQTETDGEIDYFQKNYYDNLDRVTKSERYNTTSGGNLIARSETKFDGLNRVYQSIQYGVDPSSGTVGNSLTSNTWFDESGNTIKSLPAGSDLFTKTTYDSLGRTTKTYKGYDLDETTYADAFTVSGDTILEQSEVDYDDASNAIESRNRQRYHDAPASQTGELKNPSTTPKARVSYSAMYPDAIGRQQANANYGTNGGSTLSRSSNIPTRSDDILVNSMTYDDAGNQETRTDPSAMVNKSVYDDSGRQIEFIENYHSSSGSSSSSSGGCDPSDDTNRTTQFTYTPDGQQSTMVAINSRTGNQTTTYTYGTTLSDSDVASSLLLKSTTYPDSSSVSDVVSQTYNRQRQTVTTTDQRGCVHTFEYDKLGRPVHDRVTTVGTGVDNAVLRLSTTYEVRGLPELLTTYDNATVGSGSIVNEIKRLYNNFAQLTESHQSHSGAVSASTPKVQLTYANGSDNTVRQTGLTYPNGRELTYDFGAANSMSDALSRVETIEDDDTTHLVEYEYLGLSTFVIADQTEPDLKWTLVDLSNSNDPDTGDIYSGLDRFGRTKDCRWYDYGSSSDAVRLKYGYDRSSNRLWREDLVAQSNNKDFDELYSYDGLQRLQTMERGLLNSGKTAITNQTYGQCWNLDATENWTGMKQAEGGSTWTLEQARTANTVNEITNITETTGPSWANPAYDPVGNMSTIPKPADPTNTFTATWDPWNRLVKLEDDGTSNTISEYQYDAEGRRIAKKIFASGVLDETHHIYLTPDWQTVEERIDSSSNAKRQFVWGMQYIDDLVLRDRDTTSNGALDERLYGLHDANWNIVAIANNTGTIQQRFAYQPFGESVVLSEAFATASDNYNWKYRFTSREFDNESALFYFRARYLSPTFGTFISRDPLNYIDGSNLSTTYFTPNGLDPQGLAFGEFDPNWWREWQRYWNEQVEKVDNMTIDLCTQACLDWFNKDKKAGDDWMNNVPDCPCEQPSIWNALDVWYWSPGDVNTHPGCTACFRSIPLGITAPLKPGQQCCYDSKGDLITSGTGAGTVDKINPTWNVGGHFKEDVYSSLVCAKAGLSHLYNERRPPNTGPKDKPCDPNERPRPLFIPPLPEPPTEYLPPIPREPRPVFVPPIPDWRRGR